MKISGVCWNGYFLLLGNAGFRDPGSQPSVTEVLIDSTVLTRKLWLRIHKRSITRTHSHLGSGQEAEEGQRVLN